MSLRQPMWPRRIALICMMAVLALVPQTLSGVFDDVRHGLHGDVPTSDGGWIIADCHDAAGPCVLGGHDAASSDGHHHHGADPQTIGLLSASAGFEIASLKASPQTPPILQRLEDADVRKPGRVPRPSIRRT